MDNETQNVLKKLLESQIRTIPDATINDEKKNSLIASAKIFLFHIIEKIGTSDKHGSILFKLRKLNGVNYEIANLE